MVCGRVNAQRAGSPNNAQEAKKNEFAFCMADVSGRSPHLARIDSLGIEVSDSIGKAR